MSTYEAEASPPLRAIALCSAMKPGAHVILTRTEKQQQTKSVDVRRATRCRNKRLR